MNKYGSQIRERWGRLAPARTAELSDAETFFQDLGVQVLARVDYLASEIERSSSLSEEYLTRVGQLRAIQMQAEEVAMSELEWPEPELSAAEEREEWESTSTQEEALIEWAASWESAPPEDALEDAAAVWMLSTDFLRELAMAENPWTYSAEHSAEISSSQDRRFQRYLAGQ